MERILSVWEIPEEEGETKRVVKLNSIIVINNPEHEKIRY